MGIYGFGLTREGKDAILLFLFFLKYDDLQLLERLLLD